MYRNIPKVKYLRIIPKVYEQFRPEPIASELANLAGSRGIKGMQQITSSIQKYKRWSENDGFILKWPVRKLCFIDWKGNEICVSIPSCTD